MYHDVNEKIEKVSEIMYFILVKFGVPGLCVPALIVAMVNYYILEMGEKSFLLPSPAV